MQTPEFLLIEGCDFHTFPIGGQLTSALNFMRAFGDRIGLVGITHDDTPTGRWIRKQIGGREFWFFGVGKFLKEGGRPVVPRRLSFFLALRKHRKAIFSLGCRHVLMQAPESLLAAGSWNWKSICYRMAGVGNALETSRYLVGRMISAFYQRRFLERLKGVDAILASADSEAIAEFIQLSEGRIEAGRVVVFPTRVDTAKFHPIPIQSARAAIGVPGDALLAVTVGRINQYKGWRFLLDAFQHFQAVHSTARLIFVGEGEDRPSLEQEIESRGLRGLVEVTGVVPHQSVTEYLNASDLVVIGSEGEGWSLAMTEALACGRPMVSTAVSGAPAMIQNGQNGFIVERRDPAEFAVAMNAALFLDRATEVSLALARNYSVATLARDLYSGWPALAASRSISGISHPESLSSQMRS